MFSGYTLCTLTRMCSLEELEATRREVEEEQTQRNNDPQGLVGRMCSLGRGTSKETSPLLANRFQLLCTKVITLTRMCSLGRGTSKETSPLLAL